MEINDIYESIIKKYSFQYDISMYIASGWWNVSIRESGYKEYEELFSYESPDIDDAVKETARFLARNHNEKLPKD